MTTADLQKQFPSFEPELITELYVAAQIKEFEEGETIMRTGQNIRSAIVLLSGLVKIYREDSQGNEFFMYYLEAGKACAISLVCAMGKETSTLRAAAVTNGALISIPASLVNEWMGKYKSWAQFAVNTYRERFEELLQTIDHIAFQNMDERLVFYLKRHQKTLGSTITISITQIATDLNSSREVISRLLRKLSEKGIVQLNRSTIEIINLDAALA